MSFVHIPDRPALLTADEAKTRYSALTERIEGAQDAEGWLSLFADWNELSSYVRSEGARRRYRYSKHMDDPEAEELERAYREEITPVREDADAALTAALLATPHLGAVAERYGEHLRKVLEVSQEPIAPVNNDLRVTEGDLAKQYDKRVAGGKVTVDGNEMTLPRARGLLKSGDAAERRAAFEAYYGWFLNERDALAAIYDRQVAVRTEMGKNLKHDDFVPLGYAGMHRTDYGPAESKAFRDAVEAHASPLFAKICAGQAAALGQETLPPWDRGFHPELTLPRDVAEPIAEQLDKAERVFDRLSSKLADHFRAMRKQQLIDLENREAKRAGAFCTAFSDEAKVAIFCNSVGDEGDVATLMHEMGHAFQGWESQWIDAVDLRWPTSDAAEVHSMGMEYLSIPHLGEFFAPDQRERFARGRWRRGVELLCYVCIVDAFQHWVYANPEASPEERDATWIRLQDTYLPGIDWSGDAERFRASRWYAQLHIFRYPFYYLDYAVAETGAMQLAMLNAQDSARCLETYLELCRLGGTGSVLELFASAGLRSPFDPTGMRDLMAHAAEQLGL